ncbi:MAG: TonB C-terminal domain-containing protein [Burkholderiaceae bacterium]|nr:TonB C-terminal domain-containing protein [Burkholderiaceae bacterium]
MIRTTRISESGSDFVLSMCLIVTLMAMTHQAIAHALIRFDLPAQPLDTALVTFGGLTGYSVLVASNLAAGRQAAAVVGDFEPREALQKLLVDTGLVARYSGSNAFTLALANGASDASEPDADAASGKRIALAKSSYALVLQASLTRILCRAQPDAFGRYRAVFQLWINDDGAIRDVRLLESTGLTERDAVVQRALRQGAMDAAPPARLAQPISILLTPRPDPAADCQPYLSRMD